MVVTDQLQRKLYVPQTPKRIVSLVPSQTELLVDMGLEEQLLGITKFCVHPSHLRKTKVVVGGTKAVHFDKIAALNPDIIICNKEENTLDIVAEAEKIAPVFVSDVSTFEDCLVLIELFGEIFNRRDQARELINEINRARITFEKNNKKKPLRKTLYLIWKNPYMAAGSDTFINEMLKTCRLENTVTSHRYPEVSTVNFETTELILLSSEPYPFREKDVRELQDRYPGKTVLLVNGEFFSWYGSRLLHAFYYFKSLSAFNLK